MTDREPPHGGPSVVDDADFLIEVVPAPARRRRKWLVWTAAAAGALAIICFAGCMIFSLFCTSKRFTTPAEVLKSAQEITEFTPPPGFEGELAEVVVTPLFLVRKTHFQHTSGKGTLLVAEVNLNIFNHDDVNQQTLEQLGAEMRRIVATEETVASRTIRGETVEFHIRAGEDALSTTKYHEIRGEFPGKSGRALLWAQIEDSIWDESAANALLDSIH